MKGLNQEYLQKCWSNFLQTAPQIYITKETEWHLLLVPVSFSEKPNIPICNLLKWDRGFSLECTRFPYCLNSPIRLLGVDDPCLRLNLGTVVLFKRGLAPQLLSWQWHGRCHFVSFVIYMSGAKFTEHCCNIPRDILDWVLYCFSGTTYDVITFFICIIQKRKYLLNNKIFQNGKQHSSLLSKVFQISSSYSLLQEEKNIMLLQLDLEKSSTWLNREVSQHKSWRASWSDFFQERARLMYHHSMYVINSQDVFLLFLITKQTRCVNPSIIMWDSMQISVPQSCTKFLASKTQYSTVQCHIFPFQKVRLACLYVCCLFLFVIPDITGKRCCNTSQSGNRWAPVFSRRLRFIKPVYLFFLIKIRILLDLALSWG